MLKDERVKRIGVAKMDHGLARNGHDIIMSNPKYPSTIETAG